MSRISNKPPFPGHQTYASGIEEHGEKMNFGSAPRVGQSKPYVSGSNAHGKRQSPRGGGEGKADGGSSITQEHSSFTSRKR
jgi:hypothetical protein